MYKADTLSRPPSQAQEQSMMCPLKKKSRDLLRECFTTKGRLEEYSTAQQKDPVCARMREYCESEWPAKEDIPPELAPYFKIKNQLTLCENLLLYNG